MATSEPNGYAQRAGLVLQTVVVVSLFVGAFWAGVIAPLNQRQERLDEKLAGYITREEHAEFKLRIDKDIANLNDRTLRDRQQVVPRTEHEARWHATDENIKLLSDRLNELRTATASTYTVRDEVVRLQNELSDIRSRLSK